MGHSLNLVSITELKPYVRNSRRHSEEQIKQLMNSIREFGFTVPILIDEDNILLAGHGRLEAAKKLEMREVPCITLFGLTDLQKKAYVIADNKLTLNAEWDFNTLKLELDALEAGHFDLDLTGFDTAEIVGLFTLPENFGEEEKPSEFAGSCLSGDTWFLGDHKLIVGLNNAHECDIIINNYVKNTGNKATKAEI